MANIGTLAVNVIARTGKFTQAMGGVRKNLNKFAGQAKAAATSAAGFGSALLAVGAGAGIVALTKNSFDSIDATAKLSDRLNIATEDLVAFQHGAELAGLSTATLDKSLEMLVRRTGEVRMGTGMASKTFDMLGISADQLANMDTGEGLRLIADRLNALPTAADKAAAATNLFGRSGGEMVKFLEGGSAGLDALAAEAEKLGISFSRVDAAKVEQANDAMNRLSKSFMGAFQTLAIRFAPAVTALSEKLTELLTTGDNIKGWLPTWEGVGNMIGIVLDVVDVFHDTFLALQAGVTKGLALFLKGWEYQLYAIQELINLLPGVEVEFSSMVGAMADELDNLANEQWEDAKSAFMEAPPSSGFSEMMEDVKKSTQEAAAEMTKAKQPIEDLMGVFEANTAVDDFNTKLREQIDTFGMSSREAEIAKLAQMGASAEVLNSALALDAQLTAMENAAAESEKFKANMEDLAKQGATLAESFRTPGEQFEATIADLMKLLEVGAINEETFRRAADKAKMEFAESIAAPTVPVGASAIDARSAEGISRLRQGNRDPMKDALKVANKQLDVQREQKMLLGNIAKKISSSDKMEAVSIP